MSTGTEVSKKILRKFAFGPESSYGVYAAPSYLVPVVSGLPSQSFASIEDNSIVGVAHKSLPLQGVGSVSGSMSINADVNTIVFFLEQLCGAAGVANVYTPELTHNSKSASICIPDAVNTNKYAGVVFNGFKFASQSDGKLVLSFDALSPIREVRDGSSFPSISVYPGVEFLHQHLGDDNDYGYVRLGDQSDELIDSDQIIIKSIEFGLNWNFALDSVNNQVQLQPQSGQAETTLSLQIAEHSNDTIKTWLDNRTKLQMSLNYYASSTAQLLVEIPNFIISEAKISEDDKAKIDITCIVGRNGIDTNYDNDNMEFNAPIRFTVTNS